MSSPGKVELDWWGPGTLPPPASIVWCNFPQSEELGKPGPKARPGLVFAVRYVDDPPSERFYVKVAYGTSVTKIAERPLDFTISNAALLDILRLPQATRFDLDNVLWLPWAKPFFCARKPDERGAIPTISTLPGELQRILGWTMADRERRGMDKAFRNPPSPVSPD